MLELTARDTSDAFAALLQVRPHHLRSVQIERDYPDPSSTLHYVVTPFVDATLRRPARSFPGSRTFDCTRLAAYRRLWVGKVKFRPRLCAARCRRI